MNRETEMLMEAIEESRGKMILFKDRLSMAMLKGASKGEAAEDLASFIRRGYEMKLENSFGTDPFFQGVLRAAIEAADYRAVADWLASEVWDG